MHIPLRSTHLKTLPTWICAASMQSLSHIVSNSFSYIFNSRGMNYLHMQHPWPTSRWVSFTCKIFNKTSWVVPSHATSWESHHKWCTTACIDPQPKSLVVQMKHPQPIQGVNSNATSWASHYKWYYYCMHPSSSHINSGTHEASSTHIRDTLTCNILSITV